MTFNFTPTSALADVVFGLDLLSSLGSNTDNIAIYNGATQMFPKARPLKAIVREPSRIMKHPAETGVTLADYQVIDPVIIELPIMIPSQYYAATYQAILDARNAPTLLSVKTPLRTYANMIISDLPSEYSPEHYNAVIINLKLEQILYVIPGGQKVAPANYNPAAPANQNTVKSGLQQGAALGTKLLARATGIISYISTVRKFY